MKKPIALIVVLTPTLALAHPGAHPMDLFAVLAHLLSEPDHLALIVLALMGAAIGLSLIPDRENDDSR